MIRRKKNVKKGIQFCLMVCGASGTGELSFPPLLSISAHPQPQVLPIKQTTFTDRILLRLTGRTTFVNTLCGKSVLSHRDSDDPTGVHVEDGVKIKPYTVGTNHRSHLRSCSILV